MIELFVNLINFVNLIINYIVYGEDNLELYWYFY